MSNHLRRRRPAGGHTTGSRLRAILDRGVLHDVTIFASGGLNEDELAEFARAGAPISMPIAWDALARTTAGNQFTVLNWKKHLKADPWAEIGKVRQKLT